MYSALPIDPAAFGGDGNVDVDVDIDLDLDHAAEHALDHGLVAVAELHPGSVDEAESNWSVGLDYLDLDVEVEVITPAHALDEPVTEVEMIFVDSSVDNYESLIADLLTQEEGPQFEIVTLDSHSDGVEQISHAFAGRTDVAAVHVVSHGAAGQVQLGSTILNADNLDGYAGELAGWRAALTDDADLLFYGCDLAGDDAGETLLAALGELTGADVAASDDLTGHESLGGDWESIRDGLPRQLIFVDESVDNYQSLVDDILHRRDRDSFEIVRLSADKDGVSQISEYLAERRDVSAVHIVSHGSDGQLRLGSTSLSQETLQGYAGEIALWSDSLTSSADLLIYGCDLAATADGEFLVQAISKLTGADVAASDDATGHKDLGGDWLLEYTIGDVSTDVAFGYAAQASWYRTLDITTGLVGHWELDDGSGTTADDATANNNDGNVNGTATWTSGEIGGAFEFDPSNGEDYIRIPNSASLENVQENDYTLAAWFRPDSTPPGSGSDNDANYGILIKTGWHTGIYFGNDNRFHFDHVLTGDQAIGVNSTNTFTPGQFYHVVGVVDRSAGTVSLYVNGQHEGTSNFTGGTAAREYGTNTWKLGVADPGSSTWGWAADGAIDDARIYSRALTGGDITELAALSSGPTQTATFQEGVGGYSGTVDTFVDQLNPNANNSADTTIQVDLNDGANDTAQALIRFDNIIGSGAGQVPDNVYIATHR